MQKRIVFELRKSSENNGKILAQLALQAGETSFGAKFKVTSPTGVVIKDFPLTGWDVTELTTLASGNQLASIPVTADGKWESGTYVFQTIYSINGATPDPVTTFSHQFIPNTAPGELTGDAVIEMTADCNSTKVIARDRTNLKGWSLVTRSLTITKPPTPSSAAAITVSTSNASLETAFDYENITYTSALVLTLRRIIPDPTSLFDIYEYKTYEANASVYVICNIGICSVLQCANDQIQKAYSEKCLAGLEAIDPRSQIRANLIVAQMTLYMAARDCGNYDLAVAAVTKLKSLIPSGCSCGGDEPVPISAQTVILQQNPQEYDDHIHAGQNGVPIGGWFYASENCTIATPGTLLKRMY